MLKVSTILTLESSFTFQWTVQLNPKFHECASNLEQLVPFEECLQLHSTDTSVVQIPDYILVTNNGRSFKLVPFVCTAIRFSFIFSSFNFNIVIIIVVSSVYMIV